MDFDAGPRRDHIESAARAHGAAAGSGFTGTPLKVKPLASLAQCEKFLKPNGRGQEWKRLLVVVQKTVNSKPDDLFKALVEIASGLKHHPQLGILDNLKVAGTASDPFADVMRRRRHTATPPYTVVVVAPVSDKPAAAE